jgi:hypothetical protein
MDAAKEHAALLEVIVWIDKHTSGVSLPADERSMIASGCFDVALEHQAAIASLYASGLYGSMLAMLRILSESLVRGLWLLHCATEPELAKYKKGNLKKEFGELVREFETHIDTPQGVLSGFKQSGWKAMNGFTHTGFVQVSHRHKPGRIEANYDEPDLCKALGVAGALGLVAAGQIITMPGREELVPLYMAKMTDYVQATGRTTLPSSTG